jgi:pimeloyl-ACP methyl ester carboxylesterase
VDAKFPVLNVPYFKELCLRLKWDSAATVGRLTLPLLLLSSTKDEIVPAAQMARLRDLAVRVSAKAFHAFDATHNDIWAAAGASYWAAKKSFIQQHCS